MSLSLTPITNNFSSNDKPIDLDATVRVNLDPAVRDAAYILVGMRSHSASSRISPTSSYDPVPKKRRKVSKAALAAIRLKDEWFQRFYPPGGVVRLNRKDYRVVSAPEDGFVLISRNGQETRVSVSLLKPNLKNVRSALILDKDDPCLRHAPAKIFKIDRGCVSFRWEEFKMGIRKTTIQEPNALARIIPYLPSDLRGLPAQRISCEMPNGTTMWGTVYNFLDRPVNSESTGSSSAL